jgi:hypothetical protein
VQVGEHQHRQQRLGAENQARHHQAIAEQAAQALVGGQIAPADRVGGEARRRPDEADRRAAKRRPDHERAPGGRLEAAIGHDQVRRCDERFEVSAACGLERDLCARHHDGHEQQLSEREPAEQVRDGNRRLRREADQVHRDHHRTLATELHPRTERERECGSGREPDGAAQRDLARSGCSTRIAMIDIAPNPNPVP